MTRADIEVFFAEYFGRMRVDLGREIQFQRDNPQSVAGNVLVALGLMTYTEVLGRLVLWNPLRRSDKRVNPKDGRVAFYKFLDRLDDGWYHSWRLEWRRQTKVDLYDVLRNGLAHQYVPKVAARLWFGFDEQHGFENINPGILEFRMEPYYRHFCEAGERLHQELQTHWDPEVPLERRFVVPPQANPT